MIKNFLCFSIVLVISINLFAQSQLNDSVTVVGLHQSNISIVQLIVNLQKYNGFKISVTGYIHIKFEDCAIYLTKVDADYLNGTNSLWVNFNDNVKTSTMKFEDRNNNNIPIKYFDCKYVSITGIFNLNDKGHMGMFAGSIDSVETISEERQWYDGEKDLWEDKLDGKGLVPVK